MPKDDVPSRFAVDFAGVTLLGIYRVESKIADGGMGSVWLGEDTNLGRRVVVKVPHVRFLGEPGFRARFKREITELVRLEHPSICRILAQGVHEEIPFFVLQYLGGGSLEERLRDAGEGPRDIESLRPWLRPIAATLDFIHGRGVVHRDVKPENILFDAEGHLFLSDFGVVKALEEDLQVTDAGTGVGSPRYMAPEQAMGRGVSGAADQYGLATTVYEALTGRLPFSGATPLAILLDKQNGSPTPIAELAPDLPQASADAIMRGIDADPEERFSSCRDFADAVLAGAGIFDGTPATGSPSVAAAEPADRRRPTTGAILTLVLLAAGLLGVGFAAGWFADDPPARVDETDATDATDATRGDASDGADEGASGAKAPFAVTLLSPGAAPRSVLRYSTRPGAESVVGVDIATRETRVLDGEAPPAGRSSTMSLRLRIAVTDVAASGDASFDWEILETSLGAVEAAPPEVAAAIEALAASLAGRGGTGRRSARGIPLESVHRTELPDDPGARAVLAAVRDMIEQISTPLPREPVGVGARWEVTNARNHIEGVRVTQTATYEVESMSADIVTLRMYIAVAALNQAFNHPEIPADANARVMRVHGDGEGTITVDLRQLGDESVRMTLATTADITWNDAERARQLEVSRALRYSSDRE